MKTNLDTISKRLCIFGCVAAFVPQVPSWIALTVLAAGLSFMLAHELTLRKQKLRTGQFATETK